MVSGDSYEIVQFPLVPLCDDLQTNLAITFRNQRSLSFPGDGYTCYPEAEPTAVDEPPKPQCVEEMCWCPRGWEYRNNECMPQEGSGRSTDVSPDRDCKYNKGTFVQMHSSTAVSPEFVWFINLGL